MKSNTLIQLPNFDYTSLDFESIIDDIQRIILEHPEYLENWDSFLETDAGRMLLEMNAFIMEKFTSKLDWIAREMFIGTATQKQSQINILQLINYKPKLPTASSVKIHLKLAKWVTPFNLPALFAITGKNTAGTNINFECLEIADDGKPNYNYIYTVDTGDVNNKIREIYNVPFYQGSTRTETGIVMDGVSNERFTLQSSPVIQNSIRVYSSTTSRECLEVESFISPEAQQQNLPNNLKQIPFMIKTDAENKAEVIFGHNNIVTIPEKGEVLQVIYRIGGGATTNSVKGDINTTKTLTINNERITAIFTNPYAAFGGVDSESIEEAKLTAPLSLRTANKTVTNEDYITHLEENSLVKHAKIIAKENEPPELYQDYGYFLPPLDTWIYITPERESLEDMNPINYNVNLQLSKSYIDNGWYEYEDFEFSTVQQTAYLFKLRKYQYYNKHVTLLENTAEGINGVCTSTFIADVDFTLDYTKSEITRIQTIDNGTIPADTRTLRIFYIKSNNTIFESKCFRTFSNGKIILSDNALIELYPAVPIILTDKFMAITYREGVDYSINYMINTISLIPSGNILEGDTVLVTYADYWDVEGESEEKTILDSIKDKKMLCVDNHIKETVYSTFDLVATIYCYKNFKRKVESTMPDYLRANFNIETNTYNYPINKAEIIALTMGQSGVRFVEIDYLGRDYAIYRKYVENELTLEQLNSVNANKVEHKIIPKYNEIIVLANDEYDGVKILENKRHGIILKFVEA